MRKPPESINTAFAVCGIQRSVTHAHAPSGMQRAAGTDFEYSRDEFFRRGIFLFTRRGHIP
ncbi:hypothetical protein [Suttonella indologenes]|uniref:hypothetical protein n=1 Tax=Suttonella indologenes TaxID=13276 RepID=UPI000E1B8699|nr:hypothetical protein [Suttonella indologenes]